MPGIEKRTSGANSKTSTKSGKLAKGGKYGSAAALTPAEKIELLDPRP